MIDVADLEARLGPNFPTLDEVHAQFAIDDVTAQMVEVAGDLLDPDDPPAGLVPVLVQAVRRYLTNPDGYGQEAVDGYSFGNAPREGMLLTRREKAAVRAAVGLSGVVAVGVEGYLPMPASEQVPSVREAL